MATDYKINLAKELTSTPEERARFYNGMLIYLAACTAGVIFTAYLFGINTYAFIENRFECRRLLTEVTVGSNLDAETFKDPEKAYAELEAYSHRIASLKQVLAQRIHLLPVVHNLFLELPGNVELQSLSADKEKLSFGLVMPPSSAEAGDPVRNLRDAWEKNEVLERRVASIRPVTGERRAIGERSVFFVKFECVLN